MHDATAAKSCPLVLDLQHQPEEIRGSRRGRERRREKQRRRQQVAGDKVLKHFDTGSLDQDDVLVRL